MISLTKIAAKTLRTIFAFGIITTLLVACKPNEKPPTTPEKITIAHWSGPGAALVHIAFAKGFFAEESIEAISQPHPFGKLALHSVLEGKADIATAGDTPVVFAIMNGEQIRVLASIQTANKNEAIVARQDRGISKPFDLKGKKIGVTLGTTADFFVDSFLLAHGIERNQVTFIDMPPGEMSAALASGTVDAVSTFNPTIKQLENKLGNRGIVFFGESIYTEAFVTVAGQEYVKKHPEAIKRFLRALIKAETFVKQHSEEARTLESQFAAIDPNIINQIWNDLTLRVTITQSLLVDFEDQTRWVLKNNLSTGSTMPNYLDYIYVDGLNAVNPDAVRIVR